MFGGNIGEMKQMIQNPAQAAPIQRLAFVLAEMERSQTDAVNDLADALDADAVRVEPVDVDERKDEILDLIGEMTPGGGDVTGWYVDHRLGDLDSDPDTLRAYVQMDPEDWDEQMADRDRDQCDELVREQHGAPSLEWWETNVIDVDDSTILRDGLVGHFVAVEGAIRAATAAARDDDE